jgi:hypothetical protein
MQVLCGSVGALAVASIYYTWRAYFQAKGQQDMVLRQRIVYMLWVMAQTMD